MDIQCSYVLLEVHDTNLTVGVPLDSADVVGLRAVLDGAMASLGGSLVSSRKRISGGRFSTRSGRR